MPSRLPLPACDSLSRLLTRRYTGAMARLSLLLGPAGSGKTYRVVDEVAGRAAQAPFPSTDYPPLLVIVPEQQAVSMERAILARLAERGAAAASGRVHVMGLGRLATVLARRAGMPLTGLSELGRQLLCWRLLDGEPEQQLREALAGLYAGLVAELALYGTAPQELTAQAVQLAKQAGQEGAGRRWELTRLAVKLEELAGFYLRYQQACSELGLNFRPLPALVPELLREEHWPHLAHTEVWVDGFAGFTPAEERALGALLKSTAGITATVLIDPARRDGPLATDEADWYAPTRELLVRWHELAAAEGVAVEETELAEARRWPAGSPLASVANGLQAPAQEASPGPTATNARFVVCPDQRIEVDAAAAQVLDLAAQGVRFGEISVVARTLQPYADLLAARFSDCQIPCFIDQREPLNHHPAVELIRCGLRLALGLASEPDLYTLLKTDLLPGFADLQKQYLADQAARLAAERERIDALEQYAREHALAPGQWLAEAPWRYHRELLRDEERRPLSAEERECIEQQLAQLDRWRRELLTPVAGLAEQLKLIPAAARTVTNVLAAAWGALMTPGVARRLAQWAESNGGAPQAAAHTGVLKELAGLFDELAALAGTQPVGASGVTAEELCGWVEYGLNQLSLGYPPPRLDCVLVTDVERGRHPAVRASLLLGLSADAWPVSQAEQPYFADNERTLVNTGARLLARGAAERAEREPYLALVAATRASEFLYVSRPAADRDGRRLEPSPYYTGLQCALGCADAEPEYLGVHEGYAGPRLAASAADLSVVQALGTDDARLAELIDEIEPQLPAPLRSAREWSQRRRKTGASLEPLPAEALRQLFPEHPEQPRLRLSASQLETFAACPFKHFARYLLRLREPDLPSFDALRLGRFYHSALERLTRRALATGGSVDPEDLRAEVSAVLAELGEALGQETGRHRVGFVLERAGVLLAHHAAALALVLADAAQVYPELRFGAGGELAPLRLDTPAGELELSGYIDRLDVAADGAVSVVDYKLASDQLHWPRFLAGQQIQLFVYLLAVLEGGLPGAVEQPAESLKPGEVALQRIEPKLSEREPFKAQRVSTASAGAAADQAADLLGNALAQARRILGELGAGILSGQLAAAPLRERGGEAWTACRLCSYRALCRFDPLAGDQYRLLLPGGRQLSTEIAAGERDFTGSAMLAAADAEGTP